MIKGVIFDFNGTLYFDTDIHVEVWRELYKELSHRRSDFDQVFGQVFGGNNKLIIKHLYQVFNEEISEERIDELSKYKEKLYRDYSIEHNRCHLVNGAADVMTELKKNYPINLATASIIENVNFFYDNFGIAEWFDKDKVVYDNGKYTGKTEMYIDAANNIELTPAECLIFEDSDLGVKSAYAAGCRNIVVLNPKGLKKLLPGVIANIRDFSEFDFSLLERK